jgi:hypothetical protein
MSNVRIVMSNHGRGEVFIDGKKIDCARNVQLSAGVDQANQVTLMLIPDTLDFEGVADVTSMDMEVMEWRRGERSKNSIGDAH